MTIVFEETFWTCYNVDYVVKIVWQYDKYGHNKFYIKSIVLIIILFERVSIQGGHQVGTKYKTGTGSRHDHLHTYQTIIPIVFPKIM